MLNPPDRVRPQPNYDPRWFIWTIVFLVATGVSLVTYIMFSDNAGVDDSAGVASHHLVK